VKDVPFHAKQAKRGGTGTSLQRHTSYRRLSGPRGRSGRVEKISPPLGLYNRTIKLVGSRYTDYAITGALKNMQYLYIRYGMFFSTSSASQMSPDQISWRLESPTITRVITDHEIWYVFPFRLITHDTGKKREQSTKLLLTTATIFACCCC